MQQPCLIIIAGCNGAGKSTYSKIISKDIPPFDFDKRFLNRYRSMPDSELREEIAKNITASEFENELANAFSAKESFAFETNLMLPYPEKIISNAKKLGFRLEMYFFCLKSQDLAKERVGIRVKNDGHFVDDKTISLKWKEGYKNINLHYSDFDYLLFVDNSEETAPPTALFEMEKIEENSFELRILCSELPEYTERRLPEIFDLLNGKN
jgi:predicted ABC-type ATPase